MQWILVLATTAMILGVQAADDCGPPKPGDKLSPPWECCKVKDVFPDPMMSNVKECIEKFPKPSKPDGPPAAGAEPTPSPEMRRVMTCTSECVFSKSGLLTPDKKLDQAAVTKMFVGAASGDKDMETLVNTVAEKCFASYSAEVDQSLECKSGAHELEKCLMREGFLSCPKSMWTDSAECSSLKSKVTKCPKMLVMLVPPKHP